MILDGVDRFRVNDPLFECVRVVLAYRGEKYTPAYIQGISGAAFRIAGPCPCSPTCSAAMDVKDLPALLGYETVYYSLCEKGMEPAKEVHKLIARVRDEIRAGRPVIVWHAFTSAEFDVVCGFDEEKHEFVGRGTYKGLETYARAEETRPSKCGGICPELGAIFVGKKTGSFDARRAEIAALEEAVRHAHSGRDAFVAEAGKHPMPWRWHEGLACYDGWLRAFIPGGFDPGQSYPLSVYGSTHVTAASFLREIAPRHAAGEGHLLKAAEFFATDAAAIDQVRQLLHPKSKPPEDDFAARKARALARMTEARQAYADGIEQLEQALVLLDPAALDRARRPSRIARKSGSAVIQGVPRLAWGEGRDCTYIGAMAAAMKVTAHPYNYSDLMSLCGLAFRTRWSNGQTKTRWCCSAHVGELPDEANALKKLTGWRLPADWIDPAKRDIETLRAKIVASIDAGQCVIVYPTHWDISLVYGYEEDGRTLLLRDYHTTDDTLRLPLEKLGFLQAYLGEHSAPPPLRECLKDALKRAVTNYRRERHDGGLAGREYLYGRAALSAWIDDLGQHDSLRPDEQKSLRREASFGLTTLLDARKMAVSFLKCWSLALDEPDRKPLNEAAVVYDKERKLAEDLMAARKTAPKDGPWTADDRQREIQAITEARELEDQAIALLEHAV